MKTEKLDLEAVKEVTDCIKAAAGEVLRALSLLESRVDAEDLAPYRRMVGKVIIALYDGLADPVLEGFPEFKEEFYREEQGRDS